MFLVICSDSESNVLNEANNAEKEEAEVTGKETFIYSSKIFFVQKLKRNHEN
jgi:hypothetical protein